MPSDNPLSTQLLHAMKDFMDGARRGGPVKEHRARSEKITDLLWDNFATIVLALKKDGK